MKTFLTHALINNTDNSANQLCNFILDGLTEYDKMKVVLEQAIYSSYLSIVSDKGTVLDDLSKTVYDLYLQLKKSIHSQNYLENDFYTIGIGTIKNIIDNTLNRSNLDYNALLAMFSSNVNKTYYGNLYVPTITKVFLDVWFNMVTGDYNKDEYPEGVMYDSALYVPNITMIKGSNSQSTITSHRVAITLNPIAIKQYKFSSTPTICLPCLIRNCDLSDYTLDHAPAIFSGFCIDHSKYVMTNSPDITFVDVCFDMVTGSSFTNNSTGKNWIVDCGSWIDCLRDMISNNRLKPVLDGELFGELLARIGENSDLVNYFKKPITKITATEALAFRSSVFSEFLTDKFDVGLEAFDEGDTEDESDSKDTDKDSEEEDNSEDSTNEEGAADEEGSDDTDLADNNSEEVESDMNQEKDQPAENVRPQIDPGKMLLELANPTDSMSDYIYRETVSRRISSLLKNPPENAMPNDLLMLKRWRSRWLYLASIACLRDFLTRVSLRLSNV